MLEIIGYLCAILIGVTLGLIGGGGSILTVPVLVYILGVEPILATAYSLFVVGTTAAVGAYKNYKLGTIDLKTAFVFAVPSFVAVYLTRRILLPGIPDHLFTINNTVITKETGIMVFFALIMFLASGSMVKKRKVIETEIQKPFNYPLITLEGFVIGILTGLVGAGGGFLIIPALVLMVGLSMKKAVGTSLFIIAVKSLIGFTGDLSIEANIDWLFLLFFSALSVGGMALGLLLNKQIEGEKLKKGFGYFVFTMALLILFKEFFL